MQFLWKKMQKDQKGFTLVELMVVVVILGILATLAVQSIGDSSDKAKISKTKADLRTIASAIEIHKAEIGNYPSSINDLVGDYIKKVPESPVSGQKYAVDVTDGYAVLCDDADDDGTLDSGETIYSWSTPEAFTASSENL